MSVYDMSAFYVSVSRKDEKQGAIVLKELVFKDKDLAKQYLKQLRAKFKEFGFNYATDVISHNLGEV